MLASALPPAEALIARSPPLQLLSSAMHPQKSELRDGMRIDWDAPIEMDDGVVLRADVFRPVGERRYPVILSYGPYAKGLAFQDAYKSAWMRLTRAFPEVLQGSSNKYQN
jgi:predicted acyl esterase